MTVQGGVMLDGMEATEHSSSTPPGAQLVDCPLCGMAAFDTVYSGCTELLYGLPGRFEVVRCRHCGLMQTNPRPTRSEIGIYYPDSYASYAPPAGRAPSRRRELVKALLRAPYTLRYGGHDEAPDAGHGRCVLDVGSGTGDYAAQMASAGWRVSIIEPNRRLAAKTASQLGLPPERVFAGPAEEVDIPETSLDMVTMSHVLEHLHDPVGVLEKTRAWLRPGGRLRVWVPNAASWEAKAFRRRWHGLDVPRHLYHFEPETLHQLLERCGFTVQRVIPQFQSGSLASSLLHVGRAAVAPLGHNPPYRRSSLLHHLTLIPGSILLALGNAAYLDVTATRE